MKNLWIDNGHDYNKPQYSPKLEKQIKKFLDCFNPKNSQLEIVLTGHLAGKTIHPPKGSFPKKWDISNGEVKFFEQQQSLFEYSDNTIIVTHNEQRLKLIKGKIVMIYFYNGNHVYYQVN